MINLKSVVGSGTETTQAENRNDKFKKGLIIAGGIALAGISVFAVVKHKKKVNAVKAEQIQSQIKELERLISKPTQRTYMKGLSEIIADTTANEAFSVRIAKLQKELYKLNQRFWLF